MMRQNIRVRSLIGALCMGLALGACEETKKTDEGKASTDDSAPAPTAEETATAASSAKAEGGGEAEGDGKVPGVDYPVVKTTVTKGQVVYAPRAETWQKRVEKPDEKLDFYTATVVEPGEKVTKIKHDQDEPHSIPNSLIIPVPADPKAEVGKVIIGPVVGHPFVGYVKEVDDSGVVTATLYNGNSHIEKKLDSEDAWWVPETPGEPGTLLHCKAGREMRFIAIHKEGDKRLVADIFGKVSAVPDSACVALPLEGLPKQGEEVKVYATGGVQEGKVKSVDADAGQVTVEYEFINDKKEKTFQVGEIEPAS